MNEKDIKELWKVIIQRPFLVISIFLISVTLSWGVINFIYSESLSSKDDVIVSKQIQIDDREIQLENTKLILNEKDILIEELRHDILKNSIKNNVLNISIQNSNLQTNLFSNWSCSEKDVIIDEFAIKISEQDDVLILCKNTLFEVREDIIELEKQIPSYALGFVGKDISVEKGGTFQADGGMFLLSVVDTQSVASINRYQTTFRLNGVGYTKYLGEYIIFDYYGDNYTLNLKSTGNPVTFFVYKIEVQNG